MPAAPVPSCFARCGSCISVTQPSYRSCTVITATPTSLKMLSNRGYLRQA